MSVIYKKKIIEAFRDNAIKSALLIDDEYLPYEEMASKYLDITNRLSELNERININSNNVSINFQQYLDFVNEIASSATENFMYSGKAKSFVKFFHSKQLICDVENGTDTLDKEKIRKSDLIVLDYHLKDSAQPNPAEYSLNLINELSRSKHMNMIVVFTREDLNDVWLEIASTLRGTELTPVNTLFSDDHSLLSEWRENHYEWSEIWSQIIDKKTEGKYLTGSCDICSLLNEMKNLCRDQYLVEPQYRHVKYLLEQSVAQYNKNSHQYSNVMVHGENKLWLQAGDVFVVLCEKRKKNESSDDWVDTTPEGLWDRIEEALIDWYPSFYRVITSELQNQIEDANLSMEKVLSKEVTEQIAALWGVLRVPEEQRIGASKELLINLLTDVVDKVQNSSELLSFIQDTANNFSKNNLPNYVDRNSNPQGHTTYLKNVLDAAKENQKGFDITVDSEFRCNVLHAYNEQISTERELPNHISTGLILKDTAESEYYLCIAPSCNTVPKQNTGLIAKRMAPHRPMRFIKLDNQTNKLANCLKDAHQSNVIFISDDNKRLALSIFPDKIDTPTIEQGVVINHDEELIENGGTKAVQFIDVNQNKELVVKTKHLKPIAKLRASFTSRYQNTQLQYEARIGVDLVSANFK
ncbi:hypothetical protein CTM76_02220 [Photobacterium phosphoreum]|uniref:response regulator receiver domain n=1 Tax=Photobacterium phosphoreum TaxID=659 RepID=UPI0007F8F587|nr:response regulator receiver domain [Photobacterium phosphoreum]OBU33926.1 hypothetical protein AYY25_06610 [Photobacterium phosphoreum]PSU80113.1 hypothetical protein CTM76_02220 [Photobacterium phosphoreum]